MSLGDHQGSGLADISALRMMRVLRPLKSLRKFPEMRLLVGSLFGSFHLLLAIVVLIAMAVFVLLSLLPCISATLSIIDACRTPTMIRVEGHFTPSSLILNFNDWNTSLYPDADLSGGQYWDSAPNFRAYQALLEENEKDRYARNRFFVSSYWRSLQGCVPRLPQGPSTSLHGVPLLRVFLWRVRHVPQVPRAAILTTPPTGATRRSGRFFSEVRRPFTLKKTFLNSSSTIPGPCPARPFRTSILEHQHRRSRRPWKRSRRRPAASPAPTPAPSGTHGAVGPAVDVHAFIIPLRAEP